jgi:hypothetical protein
MMELSAEVKEKAKRKELTFLSDAEADAISWPVTSDWSEFNRRLGQSKRKVLVRFKESIEGDWLGWVVGRVIDVRTAERLKVTVGDTVRSIVGHKFDAEFADGRENGFVFETEYQDMRVFKEEAQDEGEVQLPAVGDCQPPRKKRGRPRKAQ